MTSNTMLQWVYHIYVKWLIKRCVIHITKLFSIEKLHSATSLQSSQLFMFGNPKYIIFLKGEAKKQSQI